MRLEMLRKSMELPKDKIEKMYIVRDLLNELENVNYQLDLANDKVYELEMI